MHDVYSMCILLEHHVKLLRKVDGLVKLAVGTEYIRVYSCESPKENLKISFIFGCRTYALIKVTCLNMLGPWDVALLGSLNLFEQVWPWQKYVLV